MNFVIAYNRPEKILAAFGRQTYINLYKTVPNPYNMISSNGGSNKVIESNLNLLSAINLQKKIKKNNLGYSRRYVFFNQGYMHRGTCNPADSKPGGSNKVIEPNLNLLSAISG